MSVPFIGKEFLFTQPDGTKLPVRGWGDQHHAHFETLDGYTVARDPVSGFYSFARVSEDGDALIPTGALPSAVSPQNLGLTPQVRISRAAAKARAVESSSFPRGTSRWEQRRRERQTALVRSVLGLQPAPPPHATTGNYVGLCLLIQFPDVPATITQAEVEQFCNQAGYRGFGNNGSVHDYYADVSGGRLNYSIVVAPYYTARHERGYYTNEKIPQPERTRELIKEALDWLRASGFDFSALSADNEGYVYATNVFYAGTCINGWAKGLWPHSFHLQTPYPLTAGKNVFDYQITDMTQELTLGTFCHENGHMICDFPDLYDYGYESSGVGAFCLMCAGANISEKNPTDINPYLKYRAGWAKQMTSVGRGMSVTLAAGSNEFLIHRKNVSEYYILEARNQTGRDAALPSRGLAIWHIDETGDNRYEQMTPAKHYECSLIQADGRCDLERDNQNIGDATDLYSSAVNTQFGHGTHPASSWWDGTQSGLEITGVGAAGATVSFQADAVR